MCPEKGPVNVIAPRPKNVPAGLRERPAPAPPASTVGDPLSLPEFWLASNSDSVPPMRHVGHYFSASSSFSLKGSMRNSRPLKLASTWLSVAGLYLPGSAQTIWLGPYGGT